MRTPTLVLTTLVTGATLAAGACSLGTLNVYDSGTGGSGAGGGHGAGGAGGDAGKDGAGGGGPCTPCGSACVDTNSDPANCGACGHACAPGYACLGGGCGNDVADVSPGLAPCVVLRGGEVWCWGRDVWGEIGIPPQKTDSLCSFLSDRCQTTPVKLAGIPSAVEISAGRQAACARTASGDVYCWGSNAAGLLGHDPATDPSCTKGGGPAEPNQPCSPTPQKVALPAGVQAAQLAVGTRTACVLTTAKDVYCWGGNESGEVENPPAPQIVWKPTRNGNVNGDADQIAVGQDIDGSVDTICVIRPGQVQCWGSSLGGSIFPAAPSAGCSGTDPSCSAKAITVPQTFSPPTGMLTATSLSVGYLTGAVLQGDKVVVWGSDNYGQSGLGAASPGPSHFDPRTLGGLPPIAGLSMTFLTTLMLDATGSVWALGWGDEGQIGTGTLMVGKCPLGNGQQCALAPVKVPGLSGVVKVAASDTSAAITADGKLWMWGNNYTANLGHAPGTMGDVPCGMLQCNPNPAPVLGLP